jgi:predicted RND superfamily exporter protein
LQDGRDSGKANSTATRTPLLIGAVRLSLAHPTRIFALWALVVAVSGLGLARLEIDTSTASFLDRSDPAWATYQQSVARFGGDEFVVVALVAPRAFDPETLRELRRLTEALQAIEGVRRVDSLATVNLVRGESDGIVRLDPALADEVPPSGPVLDQLVADLRADAIAPGGLVSRDERTFAINVLLDEDVDADRAQTVAEIRALLASGGPEGIQARVSGVPVFRTAVNARTRSEVLLFTPLTLVIVGGLLLVAFRGVVSMLVPLAVGGVGSSVALGSMGGLGVSLSLSTMILPSVLLALGVAYTMHVLTAERGERGGGLDAAMVSVARPVALSGLTTVIGFLAMATVEIDAIRELATFGAIGVLAITVAALTLVPASLARWPLPAGGLKLDGWIRGPVSASLVGFLARRRLAVCWTWVLVLIGVAAGVSRLEISTDIILWFDRDTEIRADYETIRERLSGITPVNVVVESKTGQPVTRPDVLTAIGELEDALEALPLVGKAISVASPLAQLHGILSAPSERGIPDDPAMIDQYLLFLEGAAYIRDVLTSDHLTANILLRVDDNSSDEIVSLERWVDAWWSERGVADYRVETTGIMYEFGRAEEQIAYGQIRGLALALVAIGAILLALLRDVRTALIALLPNVIPLGMAFGFMGLAGLPLDAATVCMGSLALGIAVDDTIHVVTRYGEERRGGAAPEQALTRCFERVLPALLFTTVAISAGFLVLGASEFTLIRNLGFVTAGLVALCLLADATLLPALLLARTEPSKT